MVSNLLETFDILNNEQIQILTNNNIIILMLTNKSNDRISNNVIGSDLLSHKMRTENISSVYCNH